MYPHMRQPLAQDVVLRKPLSVVDEICCVLPKNSLFLIIRHGLIFEMKTNQLRNTRTSHRVHFRVDCSDGDDDDGMVIETWVSEHSVTP